MNNYEEMLDCAVSKVQEKIDELSNAKKKDISGREFENIVYDALIAAGVPEEKITHSKQHFPDFVISYDNQQIAVEVKKVDGEKWETLGGSIYESLRNKIEETFVLMGKFGDESKARIRRYRECISDLSVTHRPRLKINLDLQKGEDFLTKNDAFDLLNLEEGPDLDRRIRELLRTDKSTWYSGDTVIAFSKLAKEEKLNYFVDGVVLFPEVTSKNYSQFAPWLTYKCLVWCSNVRDVFSAGGTKEYESFVASALMNRIIERIDLIIPRIETMTAEELEIHWKCSDNNISLDERIEIWINQIEKNISVSRRLIDRNMTLFNHQCKYKRKTTYEKIIVSEFIECLKKRIKDFRERE